VVVKVLAERELVRDDGSINIQQNLELVGLSGDYKDQHFTFYGISDLDVVNSDSYQESDKVSVNHTKDSDGGDVFYVQEKIRQGKIYFLSFLFALIIIVIGRLKGLRALISLAVSFLIIMKVVVPLILSGFNPLVVGVVGSFAILFFIIYITEGINIKSHLAIISVVVSLLIISLLSMWFSSIVSLTGTVQEEVSYLVSLGIGLVDFKGLFLAAIIIGAIGILDDVIISQIESVVQIKKADSKLNKMQVFKMASEIGGSHMGAVINTLFLAYAGASLPLILLFSLHQPPFLTFGQVINSEIIATEIVRTLVGSIGVVLAVPISTWLAVMFYRSKSS